MPGAASAQMREFVGKVDKIDDKKLIVDNRKGDKVSFDKVAETTVEGTKTEWKAVKKDDTNARSRADDTEGHARARAKTRAITKAKTR